LVHFFCDNVVDYSDVSTFCHESLESIVESYSAFHTCCDDAFGLSALTK